jgi:WD40 repeat protein
LLLRDRDGVRLLDASTGETIKEAVDPAIHLLAAFSPDGAWFVTANRAQPLTLWDTKTCTRIRSLGGKTPATMFRLVAVAPDGKRIAAGASDGTISLWDPAGNELFRIKHHEGAVTCLAFSPDGNFLVSGSADTTLAVWEVKKE